MTFISSFLPSTCECLCWTIDRSRVGIFVLHVLECYVFQQHLEIWLFCKPMTSIARVYFVSEGEINALTVGMTVSSWCVNNQLGFLILPFLPKGVAWICPRLSPSMQWYWYYLVPIRNKLVQDLARFVSKNVRESSFYWTGLSLSNNLETKCFSVMLILLFYFCMFIRLLCVSLYISIIVFHVMYYVYSIHEFVFISIIISLSFSVTPGSVCGVP